MIILRKSCYLLISNVILLINPAFAQSDADALYQAENWSAAVSAYQAVVASSPEDARAWARLAVSARQDGQYDIAISALAEAEALEFNALQIGIERSRIKVQTGDKNGAVVELRAVYDAGFTSVGFLTADAVLGTLSGHAGFDALVADMQTQAYPCEYDAAFSEFDFWVGDWDVHVASGQFAGNNSITKEQRGCVLIENWTNASGSGGGSINYVDKIDGQWVQIWNDASGGQINIRGGLTDEGMLLVGTIHTVANGTTLPFRGLWTPLPDGRVRQFFEQSSDDGETWVPWFEGFYTRKTD